MGLGFPHLYTMQEIARLKDVIQHTFRGTNTGKMYRTSFELLYIEIGLTLDLHLIPFTTMSALTTDSLVKSSWQFLNLHNIYLKHDIDFEPHREGDRPIMDFWVGLNIPDPIIRSLNRCRLFLQAFYVSDISDGFGTHITEDAWNGRRNSTAFKAETWPNQGKPTRRDWDLWQKYLKMHILQRGLRLRKPLGIWLQQDYSWPWYYAPEDERLYCLTQEGWVYFAMVHKRQHRPTFSTVGMIPTTIPRLCRATVYKKGTHWICSGYADIQTVSPRIHLSFLDFLAAAAPEEKWCLEWLDISDDGLCLATALKEGFAIAVSDGSFKETYGTAAFVLEGESSTGRIVGTVIAPGNAQTHSPYRSELTGIYATMILVQKLCQYYDISSGQIEFACDGLSALNKAFSHVALIAVEEPSYDLLAAIRHQWLYSKIQWKIRHVAGHQDDDVPIEQLDRWGKLNVEMDARAKAFLNIAKQKPRHHLIKSAPWSLWYHDKKLV
jgi:hypothetical protein